MSERVSDEHMRLLEASLDKIENDYKPTCESSSYGNGCPGATDESREFWRRAVDCVPSMLAEIRERRAADLSAEDYDSLIDAQRCMQFHCSSVDGDDKHHLAARRVLGKLLARKP